ncbi:hypothetical protein [Dyella sp. A6]|uniref:hypothetical protein n=1 Tax=Dyella aluminiiresistens TaxID=3069105 RepID=UPI002E7A63EE|nr:hypothetical protein [Dyella sp. A6]
MKSTSLYANSFATAPTDEVFATAPAHTTRLLSLVAAVLITGLGVFALSHGSAGALPGMVDGIKVTTLAPVQVRPTAAELRAALQGVDMETGAAVMSLPHTVATGAGMLGAQLAMPYYSFGNTHSKSVSTKE